MKTFMLCLVGVCSLAAASSAAPPQRHGARCATPQVRAARAPTELVAAGAQRTIYLNRNGATFQVAEFASSATNRASQRIVQGLIDEFTIPPLEAGWNWPSIVSCVKQHYEKYNVRFVETEPASGVYIEAIVGGDSTELGYSPNELYGVAAADNFCGVTERGIAFSFSRTHADVQRPAEELCATIAHEIGHLLALEHEGLAQDVMSYIEIANSNTKAFVNQQSTCGPYPDQPSECLCSAAATTNSAARLLQFVGKRPFETTPPALELVAPTGRNVEPSFEVLAAATDDHAMSHVTVWIDEFEYDSDYEPDDTVYGIVVRDLPEGRYTLRVIAHDQAGNETVEERAITVAGGQTGGTCAEDESCPDGGGCASGGGSTGAAVPLLIGIAMIVARARRRGSR